MEHKQIKRWMVLIGLLAFFNSCHLLDPPKKKGFYSFSQFNGYFSRLPLIEPYVLVSSNSGASWAIEFETSHPPPEPQFLTKVGVSGEAFVAYAERELSPNFSSDHPEVWAVVDVKNKKEQVFTDEKKYKACIKRMGISAIVLYDIDTVFHNFDSLRILPPEWPKRP